MDNTPATKPDQVDSISLHIDRVILSGANASPADAEHFTAMLVAELKRNLSEQYNLGGVDLSLGSVSLDLPMSALDLKDPDAMRQVVREIARRVALLAQPTGSKGGA